jgi:hypothetical protein
MPVDLCAEVSSLMIEQSVMIEAVSRSDRNRIAWLSWPP